MIKKMTLIELLVVIVILSILLSIALIKYNDFKKQAIRSSVSQNISILQNSVDEYYLKNEVYPIKKINSLKLESPQIIDIKQLQEKGYLKRDLDTTKIKEQYYWVDVFGKVWGATSKDLHSITKSKIENRLSMAFIMGASIEGYNIYEVSGYKSLAKKSKESDLLASMNVSMNKTFKVVEAAEVSGGGNKFRIVNLAKENAEYLVSGVDEYGLELAPFGAFSSSIYLFEPIIQMEGSFEFSIEGSEVMYWEDFLYLAKTPGESTVSFKFKVKDENGIYEEWIEDFYSLDPSKGIIVQINMKGDSQGNKPSLLDLQVLFKYKDEKESNKEKIRPERDDKEPVATCPKVESSTLQGFDFIGDKQVIKYFKTDKLEGYSPYIVPTLSLESNTRYKIKESYLLISSDGIFYTKFNNQNSKEKCMAVVYDVETFGVSENGGSVQPTNVCGSNGTRTSFDSKGRGHYVDRFYLKEDQSIFSIKIPNGVSEYKVLSVHFEYSENGNPYVKTGSFLDIPSNSCVSIVYEVQKQTTGGNQPNLSFDLKPSPTPDITLCNDVTKCTTLCEKDCITTITCIEGCDSLCSEVDCIPVICEGDECISANCQKDCEPIDCEKNNCIPVVCSDFKCKEENTPICNLTEVCKPPVCVVNCVEDTDNQDPELNNSEWTTVETISFFSHGPSNQLVRWYKSETKQTIENNEQTRILYRYSKTNGSKWSNEYENFETTGISKSVMANAYIQVRTTLLNTLPKEDISEVISVRFYNELGYKDMSLVQPTLTIIPQKNNNGDRETYSVESKITWTYAAVDPRNKSIVEIQWDGDIREQYPIGTYEIKARVKNEVAIWSEWVSYILEVKPEKPIAVITNLSTEEGVFKWSMANSIDPDDDGIIDYEWLNNQTNYPVGEHIVKLRVKDGENYWSDWIETNIIVNPKTYKVYRLEAELQGDQVSYFGEIGIYAGSTFANLNTNTEYIEFKFTGTGFDLKTENGVLVSIDSKPTVEISDNLFSVRNLDFGTHTIKVYKPNGVAMAHVHHLDVYSPQDKVEWSKIIVKNIINNNESIFEVNQFSNKSNEQIKIYYKTQQDGQQTVEVLDSNGKVVRTLISKSNSIGGSYSAKQVSWNGFDNSGTAVAVGNYTIRFSYIGVEGSTSTYSVPIRIANVIKLYRLEAEIADEQVLHFGDVGSFSDSGGKYLSLNQHSEYVEFRFKGTGFDVRSMVSTGTTSKNFKIVINGSITLVDSQTISIRGLDNKNHVVRIYIHPDKDINRVDYLDVYGYDESVNWNYTNTRILYSNTLSDHTINEFSKALFQEVRVDYKVIEDSTETIQVVNSSGQVVRTLNSYSTLTNASSSGSILGGTNKNRYVIWNGANASNGNLPNGIYKIRFTYKGKEGSTTSYEKEVKLNSTTPYGRLEAETKNTQVTHSGGTIGTPSSSAYSGGKYANLNDYYKKITFTFTGTGFDLVTTNYNTVISIDGGPSMVVNTFLTSFRGLENKQHTVVVSRGSSSASRIDYLDYYK